MDLSSNKLVGEIPVQLTRLHELGLKLSNNYLSGRIPDQIGVMGALNSLNLSINKLSERIPSSLENLTFLSHLNLSNNKLSGQIPTRHQLQTLVDPSIYDGNLDLWGFPLTSSNHHENPPKSKMKQLMSSKSHKLMQS
ncbi:putative transferase [Helianthus debilis subsp. tardiflorus]